MGWQALLRSKVFFTTAFTMRYVQFALLLLASVQLIAGLVVLPVAAVRVTMTCAKCAVARVTPHSLRNGKPVANSINASDWSFGLLSNKCSVPGGKLSVLGSARVVTFPRQVEFNGFYLTSRSTQKELDPASFTLECLSGDGEGGQSSDIGPVTVAASGSCAWFVGVQNVVVSNPPPSQWQTVQNALGENETRITLDYSDGQFSCRLPPLLDHLSIFISATFFLVAAVQARYVANSAVFGIKNPWHTFLVGNMVSSSLAIAVCLNLWRVDLVLICFHIGRICWSLLLLVSEQFVEEQIFLFGLYMALLFVWASLSSSGGTMHTVFFNGVTSLTPWSNVVAVTPRCCLCSVIVYSCCM